MGVWPIGERRCNSRALDASTTVIVARCGLTVYRVFPSPLKAMLKNGTLVVKVVVVARVVRSALTTWS